ncbi:MAG TPA: helix-turn-helix domain-containing protein [Gaiellaceae bacterium]|nr:helix-turn-helix domain-containing protein [Gaiellaceae bacterium]
MTRRAYAKLTPREEQRIVALRAEGLTFDVIAARLGCSKGTVWNALNAQAQRSQTSTAATDRDQGCCTDAIAKVRALIKKANGGSP